MPSEFQGRNGKYKNILTVLDLYTRYAWAVPLKTKTGEEVKDAFEKIFRESKRKPMKLWIDKGTEFYNKTVKKLLKENNIIIYSTENESKANMCERLNRSLKEIMWKIFTLQGNQKWVRILPKVVDQYNNKIHSIIKTTPKDASENPEKITFLNREKNFKNEHDAQFQKLFTNKKEKPKFKIGDRVRIVRYKFHFEKGYTYKWTIEIFKISEVVNTSPITYRIEDLDGEQILGRMYDSELQKTVF